MKHPIQVRHAREASMEAEMRQHIEFETEARIAAGMSPDEARRTALRDFGGVDRHMEEARDLLPSHWIETFWNNVRFSARVLRRNGTYTIAAALTLGLGVGCATAIYSVVRGVLLKPLPYANPGELAVVWERNAKAGREQNVVSVPRFETLQRQSRSFTTLAALVPQPSSIGGETPERRMGATVSPGYFRLLGVNAALGRVLADADTAPDAEKAVVISDAMWREHFGATPDILGQTMLADEVPYRIVGVMPRGFDPPKFGWLPNQDFWITWQADASNRTFGRYLLVMGRLRPAIDVDAASRELAAIAETEGAADSRLAGWSMNVVSLTSQITGDVRRPLLILLGAVALLLALAATNFGGLLFGFIRSRRSELSFRRAMGATPVRLLGELATHVTLLALLGSGTGIALAAVGTRLLTALAPPELPRVASIRFDGWVLLAGLASGMIAALACVIAAALRTTVDASAFRSPRTTAGAGSRLLVVSEVALSVVLTVLAGLMLQTFVNLRAVRLGFDGRNVVTGRVSLPGSRYGTPDAQRRFYSDLGLRLLAMPGVRSAGFVTSRPFECCAPATSVKNLAAPGRESGSVELRYADSSYFPTMGINVLAGHGFTAHESPTGTPTVLINERLAHELYDGNALGKPIEIANGDPVTGQMIRGTVGAVVADVHLVDARTGVPPTAYVATDRFPSTMRDVVVRGTGTTASILAATRLALKSVDPSIPLAIPMSIDEAVRRSMARDRFVATILGAFASVSLVLAAIGIYGMFAADVTARRREIGVRIALGARSSGIVGHFGRRALVLGAAGVIVGLAAAAAVARMMTTLLFGVAADDPIAFAAVGVLLIVIALLATAFPALRAARVSPMEVIRAD